MTVTISKMSAGKGYEYFLRTVAAGDGDRSLSTPLTRYYTEDGTPPGRWVGSGIASLESHLKVGDEVAEEQLRLLIGEARHPVTGQDLGRRYRDVQGARGGQASTPGRRLRAHRGVRRQPRPSSPRPPSCSCARPACR